MLILATFLHVVAVSSLEKIGAVDLFTKSTGVTGALGGKNGASRVNREAIGLFLEIISMRSYHSVIQIHCTCVPFFSPLAAMISCPFSFLSGA